MARQMGCVGLSAPEFTMPCTCAPASTRDRAALADYRGRWLVLMFYPRDFSMVCPTELTAVSLRIEEFHTRDCDVLGVSTDSIATHERWIRTPRSQGGLGALNFSLASDEEGSVCRAYGVYIPRQHIALRGLFIIDPNGVLQYQVVHNLSVGRRTDEILRVLDGLQTGGICPESWSPESPTLDPTRALGPGHMLGQYQIEELLGSGSFAAVFRARDTTLERTVALKVLRLSGSNTHEALLTEARAAASLNHPNVCTVFAVDSSEGVPLIAMEFVPGQPLSKLLERGPLAADQARAIARQIASGMAAAHAHGVIHGDLKPANILVQPDDVAKITDFGLARRDHHAGRLDATTEFSGEEPEVIAGTPRYMSPEQARGQPLTPASDVFSFGLVLYEILTGLKAITGDNILDALRKIDSLIPDELASRLPGPFDRTVRAALTHEPGRRTLSMREIVEQLA